jgi:tetratricopeptide (TPR) repeat protein
MLKWVEYFAANPKFLTAKEGQDRSDLGERVADIQNKAKRKIAEQCREGRQGRGDVLPSTSLCGKIYLDIFNQNPEAADADELLYNAGVCFEEGRSLSTAIEAYTELRSRFPKSPQAAKALARLGAVYGQVAYYDRAAACSRSTPEVRRPEGRLRPDERRGVLPQGHRRRRQGDREHQLLHRRSSPRRSRPTRRRRSSAWPAIYEKRGDLDASSATTATT